MIEIINTVPDFGFNGNIITPKQLVNLLAFADVKEIVIEYQNPQYLRQLLKVNYDNMFKMQVLATGIHLKRRHNHIPDKNMLKEIAFHAQQVLDKLQQLKITNEVIQNADAHEVQQEFHGINANKIKGVQYPSHGYERDTQLEKDLEIIAEIQREKNEKPIDPFDLLL